MSAQLLSKRTLRRMSRVFALPINWGWARGDSAYIVHTANHTHYVIWFRGTRRGRRSYVLYGPIDTCAVRRSRLWMDGACPLNDLVPVVNPRNPGELMGIPRDLPDIYLPRAAR